MNSPTVLFCFCVVLLVLASVFYRNADASVPVVSSQFNFEYFLFNREYMNISYSSVTDTGDSLTETHSMKLEDPSTILPTVTTPSSGPNGTSGSLYMNNCVNGRKAIGGPARVEVKRQIEAIEAFVAERENA